MSPQYLREATEAVRKAQLAAKTMQSPFAERLADAETLMAEAAIFAETIANNEGASHDAATRLLSAVLGIEFRVTAASTHYSTLEGYKRTFRRAA